MPKEVAEEAFADLAARLVTSGAPALEPVFVPSYTSLTDTLNTLRADVAWCPPLVARELVRIAAAQPVATVMRHGADHYYSALVARAGSAFRTVRDLSRARIGWVSPLSAAGYVVPRSYLRSIGVPLAFREEHFLDGHAPLLAALDRDEVDVVATYAVREGLVFKVRTRPDLVMLATAGPISGDVIVVARWVDPARTESLTNAFLGATADPSGPFTRLMEASGFGRVMPWHLDTLARWFDPPHRAPDSEDQRP